MVELKGVLWKKLQEIRNNRMKRKKLKKEVKSLERIEKNITKSEDCSDEKLDLAVRNLEMLNSLSKKIVKQNQEIIELLKKKRKVVVSI